MVYPVFFFKGRFFLKSNPGQLPQPCHIFSSATYCLDPGDHLARYGKPAEAWLENLDTLQEQKLGIKQLHQENRKRFIKPSIK